MLKSLTVDVISDVICPWCYIGKRRLEKAIAALDGQHEVQVHWHPFQLNPTMPQEGISRKEYRTRKFGSWERSLELDAKVIAVGESEGIHFAFDKTERTPNTVDAHRLIWLAVQNNCQDAVVEGLFRAYFIEGRDIGNCQTLVNVAAEAGLDQEAAEAMLNSDKGGSSTFVASVFSRLDARAGGVFFRRLLPAIVSFEKNDSPEFPSAFPSLPFPSRRGSMKGGMKSRGQAASRGEGQKYSAAVAAVS